MADWLDWSVEADQAFMVEVWPDVLGYSEATIAALLEASREECEDFAPTLPRDATGQVLNVPTRYRAAQVLQARALAQAGTVQANGELGTAYPVTTFPMDWTVKALLRPATRPRVG